MVRRWRSASRTRPIISVEPRFVDEQRAGGDHAQATSGRWYYVISEKIVAITQGRSQFIWDIKVGRPARVLSKYVTRTPAGIGLGSPFTMQLAIEEVGLPRIVYAAAGGAVRSAGGAAGRERGGPAGPSNRTPARPAGRPDARPPAVDRPR